MKEQTQSSDAKPDNELIAEFMGINFDELGQCTDIFTYEEWPKEIKTQNV